MSTREYGKPVVRDGFIYVWLRMTPSSYLVYRESDNRYLGVVRLTGAAKWSGFPPGWDDAEPPGQKYWRSRGQAAEWLDLNGGER